ncbi:MAG: protein TolR [Nitrococcus sp.]|nr:protein TolR [Nitrococcus sp.]
MNARRHRRRLLAEINVVPYIDVSLVLLVIFMVTAPLLYQGVEVNLPQANAEPIPPQQNAPIIVVLDRDGNYYLTIGEDRGKAVTSRSLLVKVAAVMRQRPKTQVLIRGDKQVPYGKIVEMMARLQQVGVAQVGLMTHPPAER